MTLDTLAFAKHLQEAGVERPQAEAHAEAINRFMLPDLATKADLIALEHRLLAAMHSIEIRCLGIIAGMLGLVVAVLKLT
jgi:hypothetical protein